MQKHTFGQTDLKSSPLIYGCMRLCGDHSKEGLANGKRALHTAIESGFNHFDHADIYSAGAAESVFGEFLHESQHAGLAGVNREDIIITGKCGIRKAGDSSSQAPKRYDFSASHLRTSIDSSLNRLGCDYFDIFMLHRPDLLMDVHEVADLFGQLQFEGKVKHFGVSNFSVTQFELLQNACDMPLVSNQIEINLHNISSLMDGTLDFCQKNHIVPMAWCPLAIIAYEPWENTFSNERMLSIKNELALQAEKYTVDSTAIVLAWLRLHPSHIFPIIGSTHISRIRSAVALSVDTYSREDWYRLFELSLGHPVP